ncbi:MAG TPA: response regulator [Terriglobales bacterium]|nr:response regulator [Terriglobales bacterium]
MDEPARILAVDDSITIRKALEMILVPEGFQVDLAASGAEGIEKARQFQPDLILLDFILPDMRGSDVCRALAADPATSGVPVVLISARGAEIRQAYLDAENVVEYLVKPFTPEDVYAVVNTVLASGGEEGLEEAAEAGDEMIPAEESQWAAASSDAPPLASVEGLVASAEVTEIAASELPEQEVEVPQPLEASAEVEEAPRAEVSPAIELPASIELSRPLELPQPISTEAVSDEESTREEIAPEASEAPAAAAAEVSQPIAAAGWDDADADLEVDEPLVPAMHDGVRRDMFEAMFETLRASLEGVYVEESDTPAGATVDQARSFTELASLLTQQLGETLQHASSGSRFALGGDGSIRSLDDALLDAHRRVCRLLFRAVAAGVIEGQPASSAPARLLVVSGSDGMPSPALAPLSEEGAWQVFHIAQDFRQVPMMARCYGPTHVIVDLDNDAACKQLAGLSRSGDRRLRIIGISDHGEVDSDLRAQCTVVMADTLSLLDDLRGYILHGTPPPPLSRSAELTLPVASASYAAEAAAVL